LVDVEYRRIQVFVWNRRFAIFLQFPLIKQVSDLYLEVSLHPVVLVGDLLRAVLRSKVVELGRKGNNMHWTNVEAEEHAQTISTRHSESTLIVGEIAER